MDDRREEVAGGRLRCEQVPCRLETGLDCVCTDFPSQYLSIAGVGGLFINNSGKIDPTEHARTLQALTNEAKVIVGDRLALRYNLDGTTKPDTQGGRVFISGYLGKGPVPCERWSQSISSSRQKPHLRHGRQPDDQPPDLFLQPLHPIDSDHEAW